MTGQSEHCTYHRPDSIEAVHELLARYGPNAKLVAGGQSLSLLLRQDMLDPSALIDISRVSALSGIEEEADRVRIGGTTTYADLEAYLSSTRIPVLTDAVDVLADQQVRNMGTIGGALSHADPHLDIVPPLVCLDSQIMISTETGTRQIPVEQFSSGYLETDLGPTELLKDVAFTRRSGTSGAYIKLSPIHGGWATVGVATSITVSDDGGQITSGRIALAGVGATVVRASTAEEELSGAAPSERSLRTVAQAVQEDIDPMSGLSGSAEYKSTVATNLTVRSLKRALDRVGGSQ